MKLATLFGAGCIAVILGITLSGVVGGTALFLLWKFVIVPIFGTPSLAWWQCAIVWIVIAMLFSAIRGAGSK